jgi:hypothetical protein
VAALSLPLVDLLVILFAGGTDNVAQDLNLVFVDPIQSDVETGSRNNFRNRFAEARYANWLLRLVHLVEKAPDISPGVQKSGFLS